VGCFLVEEASILEDCRKLKVEDSVENVVEV
jgi:hypothetical protein